jgi:hypothetical protein
VRICNHLNQNRSNRCDFLSDRDVVVQLRKDGSTWINETRVSDKELPTVLAEIYADRSEKFVVMISDPDISYGDFAKVYSSVASSTDNLYILLRTPALDKKFENCPEGFSCGLDWPKGYYQSCVWFNIHPIRIQPNLLRWPGSHN